MASRQLLFASQNTNKQREALVLFADTAFSLVFPQEIPSVAAFDPEEIGETFTGIAEYKARAYAELAQIDCVADDSGITVVALGDFPGIRSNRWFAGSSEEKNLELLKLLEDKTDRRAFYTTAACYYSPELSRVVTTSAELWGTIAFESVGDQGFAYDRIFIPEGYTNTMAELGDTIKHTISPRGSAYKALVKKI